MRQEKLRHVKKVLLSKLNDLQFKMEQHSFNEIIMHDNPSDIIDKASKEFDQSVELMMRGRERLLIRELQGSLMRIDRGVFGICEVCGGRIPEKRLLAEPMSRLCMKCIKREGYSGLHAKRSLE